MKPNISLIITTYNWPLALNAVLRSVMNQHQLPMEVLIADDGSDQHTRELIQSRQENHKVPIKHIWQEDNGFQAAKIRNKAVAEASGDYMIFLDGDCLIRPDFIQRHSKLATRGFFVAGNRVLLSEQFTPEVLEQHIPVESWPTSQFKEHQINRTWPLHYIPMGYLRKLSTNKWQGVKTCNLAVWKEDLIDINGLDEAFTGWGYEDSDLTIRLLRHGIKRLNGRHATTVMHLWHKEHDRSQEKVNWDKLQQILKSEKLLATQGLSQYL